MEVPAVCVVRVLKAHHTHTHRAVSIRRVLRDGYYYTVYLCVCLDLYIVVTIGRVCFLLFDNSRPAAPHI